MSYLRQVKADAHIHRVLSVPHKTKALRRYFIATRPLREWRTDWFNHIVMLHNVAHVVSTSDGSAISPEVLEQIAKLKRYLENARSHYRIRTWYGLLGMQESGMRYAIAIVQEWVETLPWREVERLEDKILDEAMMYTGR